MCRQKRLAHYSWVYHIPDKVYWVNEQTHHEISIFRTKLLYAYTNLSDEYGWLFVSKIPFRHSTTYLDIQQLI